jgi:hypothetical protein
LLFGASQLCKRSTKHAALQLAVPLCLLHLVVAVADIDNDRWGIVLGSSKMRPATRAWDATATATLTSSA